MTHGHGPPSGRGGLGPPAAAHGGCCILEAVCHAVRRHASYRAMTLVSKTAAARELPGELERVKARDLAEMTACGRNGGQVGRCWLLPWLELEP